MVKDLAEIHGPIGGLFARPATGDHPDPFRLTADQIAYFHEFGYLPGVRVLEDTQIEALRAELERLMDPQHPGHNLFYEFHSNESKGARRCYSMRWEHGASRKLSTICCGTGRSHAGVPIAGWTHPVLARPVVPQTGPAWGCGRLAPGLLLLDTNRAHRSPDLLDSPGRQHEGKRMPALRPWKSQVEPSPDHRPHRKHG